MSSDPIRTALEWYADIGNYDIAGAPTCGVGRWATDDYGSYAREALEAAPSVPVTERERGGLEIIETTAGDVRVGDELLTCDIPAKWDLVTGATATVHTMLNVYGGRGLLVVTRQDREVLVRRPVLSPEPAPEPGEAAAREIIERRSGVLGILTPDDHESLEDLRARARAVDPYSSISPEGFWDQMAAFSNAAQRFETFLLSNITDLFSPADLWYERARFARGDAPPVDGRRYEARWVCVEPEAAPPAPEHGGEFDQMRALLAADRSLRVGSHAGAEWLTELNRLGYVIAPASPAPASAPLPEGEEPPQGVAEGLAELAESARPTSRLIADQLSAMDGLDNSDRYVEAIRVGKCAEEAGEAMEALIAYHHVNPRKPAGPREDVLKELADVALTAKCGLWFFGANADAVIADRERTVLARLRAAASPSTDPWNFRFEDLDRPWITEEAQRHAK